MVAPIGTKAGARRRGEREGDMESLRFTQRLLHYFDFLLSDYGFVYADEPDLNASFLDGGRFEAKNCMVMVRLARQAPAHHQHRNALVLSFVDKEGTGPVHLTDIVHALGLDVEPCPVAGEIRTRHMLDLALAYYARLVRSHCDSILRGETLASELVRPIEQSA
jgi:hypothetical protein